MNIKELYNSIVDIEPSLTEKEINNYCYSESTPLPSCDSPHGGKISQEDQLSYIDFGIKEILVNI